MRAEPRRAFLQRILAGSGLTALAAVAVTQLGRGTGRAQGVWSRIAGLSPEVTPVGSFYTVSKNIFDPTVEPATWRLTIGGHVERSYALTLGELRRLPAITRPHTLMCISNEIGGDLISNAVWTGVPLRALLERAGPRPGASKLVLRGRDAYASAFPLSVAMLDGTMLAYEMNGRPLERQHGFPARVLVAGRYGFKNVKWLTGLEVVDFDFRGYWETRNWSDIAIYKTFSRIDVPAPGTSLARGQPTWIAGVAFAGDRGVRAVEVSLDGGESWRPARVKLAMGDHTWVLWALEWSPSTRGPVVLVVRAVDGAGAVQPDGPKPPLPDGVEGFHRVAVVVQA